MRALPNLRVETAKESCPKCDQKCSNMSGLTRHFKARHKMNEDNLRCFVCKKDWCSFEEWKVCSISHAEKKIHKCEICESSFVRRFNLKRHIKMVHTDEEEKKITRKTISQRLSYEDISGTQNLCSFCKIQFKSCQTKINHEKDCNLRNSNVLIFQCSECYLTFISPQTLKNHEEICVLRNVKIILKPRIVTSSKQE